MKRGALLALALGGLCITAHCAVVLVDSTHNAYLTGSTNSRLSKSDLQGVIAALTGLQPSSSIDSAASQQGASHARACKHMPMQIATLVKANPFKKPQAHVSVNVAGLSQEDVASLFAGRQQVAVSLEDDEHVADAAMDVFTSLASANPDVPFQLLEQLAAESCRDGSCLERIMPQIAQTIDAEYQSATNKLVLADGTELDLYQLTDKAFAAELMFAAAGVRNLINTVRTHGTQDIAVMDLTLLGLQGLTGKYGQGSAEAVAGKEAVSRVLEWTVQQLEDQFAGDVTIQVAVFDKSPAADSVDAVSEWRRKRLSRMLQAVTDPTTTAWPGPDEAAQAKAFSAKAAAYGGFILLLYFMLAGIYCLCNMPFKKDTLLYGSKKSD